MAKRWSSAEELFYARQLNELYGSQNKTISEVAYLLKTSPSTIHKRMVRLDIPTHPEKKVHYRNRETNLIIPLHRPALLAEFFGIMLGDGKLSYFQVAVTLGNKEVDYAFYVKTIFEALFSLQPSIISDNKNRYRTVYVESTILSACLKTNGLVYNKVAAQVDIPSWIFEKKIFMKRFARGFFGTDGSVYRLRYGLQLSFTNFSAPLLLSLQGLLRRLGYRVSEISDHRFYITRSMDIKRFFTEIRPQNKRHIGRFGRFLNS
jgi:DNA-binding transcriptional regulator WhiA